MLSWDAAGIGPTSKKNRRLVLAGASTMSWNFVRTPLAVIQRGGRVGLSSVPHGNLVGYKSYI